MSCVAVQHRAHCLIIRAIFDTHQEAVEKLSKCFLWKKPKRVKNKQKDITYPFFLPVWLPR